MNELTLNISIPSEIETLKKLFVDSIQHHNETIRKFNKISDEMVWLKRNLFGKKSERNYADGNQQVLDGLIEVIDENEMIHSSPEIRDEPPVKKKHKGRNSFPENLPRIREVILPKKEDLICACGQEKEKFDDETTQELDFKPASFYVKGFVRSKYKCKACSNGVTIAPAPFRQIQKGIPGPGLLAQVSIAKYVDHLPLYRQENIFKRHGVFLSKYTLCHWVKKTYELLTPIGDEIRKDVVNSFCINADETHIRVLDKEKKHSCHNGFIWVYVGDNSKVFIEYKKTRSRAGPSELLKNYHGYLQVLHRPI